MTILDDEARVDDAGFFAQLVPGMSELQSVYDAVAVADWALAQSAFAQYMLERTHPCWMFDWRDRDPKYYPCLAHIRFRHFSIEPLFFL